MSYYDLYPKFYKHPTARPVALVEVPYSALTRKVPILLERGIITEVDEDIDTRAPYASDYFSWVYVDAARTKAMILLKGFYLREGPPNEEQVDAEEELRLLNKMLSKVNYGVDKWLSWDEAWAKRSEYVGGKMILL